MGPAHIHRAGAWDKSAPARHVAGLRQERKRSCTLVRVQDSHTKGTIDISSFDLVRRSHTSLALGAYTGHRYQHCTLVSRNDRTTVRSSTVNCKYNRYIGKPTPIATDAPSLPLQSLARLPTHRALFLYSDLVIFCRLHALVVFRMQQRRDHVSLQPVV